MRGSALERMIAGSRPEVRLALLAARRALGPAESQRLLDLARGPVDWRRLAQVAVRHGVMPLVFRSLSSAARAVVPSPEFRDLGRHFMANAMRAKFLTAELVRLLGVFRAAGIQAVPYKGPALAARLYGDPAMRISGDLDLLVRPRQARDAARVLLGEGYRPRRPALGGARLDLRRRYHLELAPADDAALKPGASILEPFRPPVELHWGFGDDFHFPADLEAWWGRLVPQDFAGSRILTLAPEETLVTLALHGSKDLWNRLILIADVAELVRAGGLQWPRVLDLASSADARRMLLVALRLARDLMEADLPAPIADAVDRDRIAARCVERIARRVLAGESIIVRPPERIPFALAVRHRARERALYAAGYVRVLVTPDERDVATVALPPALGFLYYVIRPFRRAADYVAQARAALDRE